MLKWMVIDKYKFGKVLGVGSISVIKKITNINTQKEYAVKIIDNKKFYKKYVNNEIKALSSLKHPNIIKIHDHFFHKKHHIILDLCKGGDLFSKIEKEDLNDSSTRYISNKILGAISYCHSKDIYHLDVKPENILFYDKECKIPLLSDFGSSMIGNKPLLQSVGSPNYLPPEFSKDKYSKTSDSWSFGVTLYVMLNGFYPDYNNLVLPNMYNSLYKLFASKQSIKQHIVK